MTDKYKRLVGISTIVLLIIFMVILFWFVGRPMLRFVDDPERYRNWIQDKGYLAQISFIGMMVFQVIIAIIPAEPLEICAGYTFGALEGTFLCLFGLVLGSAIVFLLVRRLGVKLVEVFFSVEKINAVSFLKDSKKRNILAFLLMFIPGTPKDLISYFAGLTQMKLIHWLAISSVARIPSIVTSTLGGNALASEKYLLSAAIFVITAVISIVGIIIYNKITNNQNAPQ